MPREDTQFKPWNPWRPAWSRSVETLFREAIKKLQKDQWIEDVERDLIITMLAKAKKWDMRAMEMWLDRLYGKPKQTFDWNLKGDFNIATILWQIQDKN